MSRGVLECLCGCGSRRALQGHHVVTRQRIKLIVKERHRLAGGLGPYPVGEEMALIADQRNIWMVAKKCHDNHHARSPALKLRILPDVVFVFAAELLGPERAFEWLRRDYAGGCAQHDALLPPAPEVPISSCDWGGCDADGVAWRWAPGPEIVGWLPVCSEHEEGSG